MKKLMTLCLLALSATAMAQSPGKDDKDKTRVEAQSPKDAARADAEEAKNRKELAEARERLDKAAREVAELSAKMGARTRREIRVIEGGPRRAVLGIQIDPDPGKQGVRVLSVSPGGPAAEAGLRDRDVIIALDGEALPGAEPDRALVTRMRTVRPDEKVKVRVLRDGKKKDYVVIARPMNIDERRFEMRTPEFGSTMSGGFGAAPMVQHFRFWPGEFEGLELAGITPKLGAYFGVTEGVLVVSAPKESAFKLEDGDVIQSIDGRKPDDGPHALRILRSYRTGEKLNLAVLRQRKPVTLAVTMPERPDSPDMLFQTSDLMTPPMPPMPAMPATPAVPGTPPGFRISPDGPGTLE